MIDKSLTFYKLRDANTSRGIEWEGRPNGIENLEFCTIELAGEASEVADAVKKLMRSLRGMSNKGLTKEQCIDKIAEECADVVICADRVAQTVGVDLSRAVIKKFNKTSDEHGFETKL